MHRTRGRMSLSLRAALALLVVLAGVWCLPIMGSLLSPTLALAQQVEDGVGPDIWIEAPMDMDVFTDGELEVGFHAEGELDDMELKVRVTDDLHDHELEEGEGYRIERDGWSGTFVFDGAKLAEIVGVDGTVHVETLVFDGDDLVAFDEIWVHVRESWFELDRQEDMTMLPGWGTFVSREAWLHGESAEHGGWYDDTYEVTGVTIKSQEPEQAGNQVVRIYDDDQGEGWDINALSLGTARIKVSYEVNGEPGEYEYTITVDNEMYDLWFKQIETRNALPGGSLDLEVEGWHYRMNSPQTNEGLSYTWELTDDGSEYARIEQDGAKATVHFFDVPADWNRDEQGPYEAEVTVKVSLLDEQGNVVDSDERSLWMQESYVELVLNPSALDVQLGQTFTITPELRYYSLDNGGGYEPIAATFELDYNEDVLSLEGEANGTYTFKRIATWGTDLNVDAIDEDENRFGTSLWVGDVDYNIWFDGGDNPDTIFMTDGKGTATIAPNLEGLEGATGWELRWVAEIDGEEVTDVFASTDNKSATIDGAKVLAHDSNFVNVCALVMYGENEICRSDWSLNVRESEVDYQLPGDWSYIPGWFDELYRDATAYVEDTEHPYGTYMSYEITDVRIVEQRPREAGDEVFTLEKEYKAGVAETDANVTCWRWRAENLGDATFEVTYNDIEGKEQHHRFDAYVNEEWFNVEIYPEGSDTTLPGGTVTLKAHAIRITADGEESATGLDYNWYFDNPEEAGQIAKLEVDEKDPSIARVTFNSRPDEDWVNDDVLVALDLMYQGEKRSETSTNAHVSSNYYELRPFWWEIDANLAVGEELTITPEVRHYYVNNRQDYDVVDATFRWEYPSAIVQVTDNGKGTYTITRLRESGAYVGLYAEWNDAWGNPDSREVGFSLRRLEWDSKWKRLAGSSRYKTMQLIGQWGFPYDCDCAVVAFGGNFPDALVASSVAGLQQCPIILTDKAALSEEAKAELERLGVKKVYIMGGNGAVSKETEDAIKAMGITTTRVKGKGRAETSIEALKLCAANNPDTVVIAFGGNYPDALSIGPFCYRDAVPIVLTDGKSLSDDEVKAIKAVKSIKNVVIVGGSGVVSPDVETQLGTDYTYKRLKGANRFETSVEIAKWELETKGMALDVVCVATGLNFPDALAGSPLAGDLNSVLLLMGDEDQSKTVADAILKGNAEKVHYGFVLGGTGAVSDSVLDYLKSLTKETVSFE